MPVRDAERPRELINSTFLWASFFFCLLSAGRGLDEGLVGGMATMKSFVNMFCADETQQDNFIFQVTNMLQLGCVFGSLLAFFNCDGVGRVRSLQVLSFLWFLGVILVIWNSGNQHQVLLGRFTTGLGMGMIDVVGPIYLAEIAPMHVRGTVVCLFAGFRFLGTTIGLLSSWHASVTYPETSSLQWITPQVTSIVLACFFILFAFTIPESPRFYVLTGSGTIALKTLREIRHLPADHIYVSDEIVGIQRQFMRGLGARNEPTVWAKIRELVLVPSNRYRLMLGVMAQLFIQWSGASSIAMYAPKFVVAVGKTSHSEHLLCLCILGFVEFAIACLCALILVEHGRKRAMYVGIIIQITAFCYLAGFLGTLGLSPANGDDTTPTYRAASQVAVGMVAVAGVGWAVGLNSAQYLINAEIWTLWIRALGTSLSMCIRFANQLGHASVVSPMLLALDTHTFFTASAVVSFLGLGFFWFFLPELGGIGLEDTEAFFGLPWYDVGRHDRAVVSDDGINV